MNKKQKNTYEIIKSQWDLAHLQIRDEIDIEEGEIANMDLNQPDEAILSIMAKPENFGWTCSKILNTASHPNGLQLLPIQCVILKEMWYRPNPLFIATRGFGKSFTLGLYALLRALFLQGRKIVIVGGGFRQSKIVFSYAENLWHNSPVLREICNAAHDRSQGPHHDPDEWRLQIGESVIKAIPLGDGQKIRGGRANDVLADEFRSISHKIFDEVVRGFGVVSSEPVEQVKRFEIADRLKEAGIEDAPENLLQGHIGNQLVISGTAGFAFEYFCKMWKKNKEIIRSGGDKRKLKNAGADPNINYKNFSIIRVPVELLPPGFMDADYIQLSQANMTVGMYENEFGAVFSEDSAGFFKRSLIFRATPSASNVVMVKGGTYVEPFSALLKGDPKKSYIMGIDTASERDNYAIVILEHDNAFAKVVYCWTTNRDTHTELVNEGVVQEKDYYAYTVRKIRDLMKDFNIIHIAMDSQGGGRTVSEALHNERYLDSGEQLIWELDFRSPLYDGKEKESDHQTGLHILEMVNFRNTTYTSEANNGMKHDLEQRLLLFPYFDEIEIVIANKNDVDAGRPIDTQEEVVIEIEELKDELTMIEVTQSSTGVQHWGAPKVKGTAEAGIGRIYDDRYSALVMANSTARRLRMAQNINVEYTPGGFAHEFRSSQTNKPSAYSQLYMGPSWFIEVANNERMSMWGVVDRDND